MEYATTVTTRFGTIYLASNLQALTRIVLPGKNISKTLTKRKDLPGVLQEAASQIQEYCEGKRSIFTLPLSPQGTEFQLRVWEIIRSIPYGRTMSYGEIGSRLGSITKARAVGGAANANPLPLVIPCHRVIGADGSLTGFAGGMTLKKKLLHLEREHQQIA